MKILIDSAEGNPWAFKNLAGYSRDRLERFSADTQYACLGRHPHSVGDYSIEGFIGRVGIERKSKDDCINTLFGFGERAERFKQELANLSQFTSCVIVECSLGELLASLPCDYIAKSAIEQRRILQGSIVALIQDYQVPWLFASSRRHAEILAYRFLNRFWRKNK